MSPREFAYGFFQTQPRRGTDGVNPYCLI